MSRRENIQWYPPLDADVSFTSMVTRVATDKLQPGELQSISNFTLESLGNLKKAKGNSVIAASELTESSNQPSETDMLDVTWDTANDYNGQGYYDGSFLGSSIGLKFQTSFFAGLSGTIHSAVLTLDSADANTYTGTAYRATSNVTETLSAAPAYDSASSVSITGSGEGSSHSFEIPTAWITSLISSNTGMVIIPTGSPTGKFYSSATTKVGYFCGGTGSLGVSDTVSYLDTVGLASYSASDVGNLTVARTQTPAGFSGSAYTYIGGGYTGSYSNVVDYIVTLDLVANTLDSGDLTSARAWLSGNRGSTYGYFGGGYTGSVSNIIDYLTLATGVQNALDAGDLLVSRLETGASQGSTYGFFAGGADSEVHTNAYTDIDYITLATGVQNGLDRGDLTVARGGAAGMGGSTHILFAGGASVLNLATNIIDSINGTTTSGAASDRGDLLATLTATSAVSNSTSNIGYASGTRGSPYFNAGEYEYIDLSVGTSNSVDCGDVLQARSYCGGAS